MKVKIAKGGLKVGTWNHRLIRHVSPSESYLLVHEVQYDAKGIARTWTADGASVGGETPKQIHETLTRMRRALLKPILRIKKVGRRESLVEENSGRRPANTPVESLPSRKRDGIHAMRRLITREVEERDRGR